MLITIEDDPYLRTTWSAAKASHGNILRQFDIELIGKINKGITSMTVYLQPFNGEPKRQIGETVLDSKLVRNAMKSAKEIINDYMNELKSK